MAQVQDPLRQLMSMADDVRKNVDSMISQGTSQIRGSLPSLPFPGAGAAGTLELPEGPEALLGKLPKLPTLPFETEKAAPEVPKLPPIPPETPTQGETTIRSMRRQVPLRPLNHVGVGRRF